MGQIVNKYNFTQNLDNVPFDTAFKVYCKNGVLYFELTNTAELPGDHGFGVIVLRNGSEHVYTDYVESTIFHYVLQEFGNYHFFINFLKGKDIVATCTTEILSYNVVEAHRCFDESDITDYALGHDRLKQLVEKYEKEQDFKQKLLQFNFIDYLLAMKITEVVVYTGKEHYDLAEFIINAIYLDSRIIITKYLSSERYSVSYNNVYPYLVARSFTPENDFSKYDTILFFDFDNNGTLFEKLSRCARVVRINDDFKNKCYNYFRYYRMFFEKARQNPNVDFIWVLGYSFFPPKGEPLQFDNPNEDEIWIQENHIETGKIYRAAQIGDRLPKALSNYGFDREELVEFLTIPDGIIVDGVGRLEDRISKHVNIIGGTRITPNQPVEFDRIIYVYGNSTIYAYGATDDGTVPAHLQKFFNDRGGGRTIVHNCSNAFKDSAELIIQSMCTANYYAGDIIILEIHTPQSLEGINFPPNTHLLDMHDTFYHKPRMEEIFVDNGHLNNRGYELIAIKLFDFIVKKGLLEKPVPARKISLKEYSTAIPELKDYKNSLKAFKKNVSSAGAIVMNCNPFTLGHRYLAEYAVSQVEHLYVFVVEEDKSFFKFDDRIKLVCQGLADIKNITVIPSGSFIISSTTFSEYFTKAKIQDKKIDSSNDVRIFAEHIAPCLNITTRFVGEEPTDNVSRQYNYAMKCILPRYGIKIEIIPRKELDGQAISASVVRKLLTEKNFIKIAELVPETTFNFLKTMEVTDSGTST